MYVRVTRTKHLLTDGTIEKAAKRNQEKKQIKTQAILCF